MLSNFFSGLSSQSSTAKFKNHVFVIACCGLLGVLASAAFAPVDFWPAILAAQFGLLYVLQPVRFVLALTGLWAFWALHFGTAMHWMYLGLGKILGLDELAAVSLTVATGIVYSAILLLPWLLYCACPVNSRLRLACFPLAWVLCEWMRYGIMGGLTWLLSGYALQPSWLAGWMPVLGVMGASLGVCVSAVLLFMSARKRSLLPLAGVLAIWVAGIMLSGVNWTQSMGNSIPATIVQPQAKAWLQEAYSAEERDQIWNREVAWLSADHWRTGLLVWPERGIRASEDYSAGRIFMLAQKAKASGTALITGANHYASRAETDLQVYNSVYGLGAANGLYFKEKLVPLGERALPFDESFRPGEENRLSTRSIPAEEKLIRFDYQESSFSVAPMICYEIAWGNYLNTFVEDANILVNLSNDRWFTQSPQLAQTLQISRVRAMEQQKPLLRASFGGFSAHINHLGDVIIRTDDTSAQTLSTTIEPRTGQTPYTRFGDLPVLALALFIWLAPLIWPKFRRPGSAGNPAANDATTD